MARRAAGLAVLFASLEAGAALAQPAAGVRPPGRGPVEIVLSRALAEGFATGRALVCQTITEDSVRRLATAVADHAVRTRQTDDPLRVVQNFSGGVEGGARMVTGPADPDCGAYRREVQGIAGVYGLTIR